jgi:hypothetical protein
MGTHRAKRLAMLGASICALAFPAGALGAEAACEGDECQGPAPAPEELTPATAVARGPGNPAPRFPKKKYKHHQEHHKRHHRRASR